jgi:predicted aldo/keto reductase-like oxidoreductase
MKYKAYGNTGKEISVIGFGGMRFKQEDYTNGLEKAAMIVRRASELGVNYFDTAPFYCNDTSEDIYGEAFKDMANPFYVSTKSNVNRDPSADDVRRRLEASLKRMGLEKINFYHMWCIKDLDQYRRVMAKGGPYEGALKLKEEGLIDHITFSAHATGEEIETIINEGAFEGVTLGYNAVNFAFRQKGIEAAYKKNLGVVTMNPLGGGIIPQNKAYFSYINNGTKDSLVQAALKFNISHKEITAALCGISSIEELEENVIAGNSYESMTQTRINEMKTNINESLDALCTGCGYCLECPKNIPIPKLMDAYNMYILRGEDKEIINRLKFHWGVSKEMASECIACGKCEKLCTQHLPIIERLKYIADLEA